MTRHRRPEGPLVAWYYRGNLQPPRCYPERITLRGAAGEIDIFGRNAQGMFVPVTQLDPPGEWQ